MKKILGFDLDGVLYSFTNAVYTELYSHNIIHEPYYDFWYDWDNKGKEYLIYDLVKLPIMYSCQIPPLSDIKILHRLAEKFQIIYITVRPPEVELTTRQYLKKYNYPNYQDVYFAKGDKRLEISSLGIEYYVEDRIKYIEALKNITNVIRMQQPWNVKYTYEPTVRNLSELEEYLNATTN